MRSSYHFRLVLTALAKNLRLSSEQQTILDEKLKLPFYEFWTESQTAYEEI